MKIEHWVKYFIPGTLFSEEDTQKITNRNVAAAVAKMPKYAFAFQFYDVVVKEGTLEDGTKITDRKPVKFSGRYYPEATTYTLDDIKREKGEDSILTRNMISSDYKVVVKTRCGNYQPLEEGDQVITNGQMITSAQLLS
jgi:hypothetical protein